MPRRTRSIGSATLGGSTATSEEKPRPQHNKILVQGVEYEPGATLTFHGQDVTLETQKYLTASAKSGVSDGTYTVVSVIAQPGNRKAFRAIVGDALYPIRQYGKEDETISKIRGRSAGRKGRRSAEGGDGHETGDIELTASADRILSDYLAHKRNLDGGDVLSDLVERHLKPELAKIRASEEAIRRLPGDLLARLAEVDEDTRRKVREFLGNV